jgi:hypothetical protein
MHDRKRIRLAGFDYFSSQHYFITMCVDDRKVRKVGAKHIKLKSYIAALSDLNIIPIAIWTGER